MTQNASKKPFITANAESRVPVSVASWNVHQVRDDLNLGHFHSHAESQGRSQHRLTASSHRPWVLVVAHNGQATIWPGEYELQLWDLLYPTTSHESARPAQRGHRTPDQ